jgi:hypothetical protein
VQQALVGESSGEEELFSPKSSLTRDGAGSDIDAYHKKIKVCNSFYSSVIIDLF